MTELNFIKATKQEMWAEIKRLESASPPLEPEVLVCYGECSNEAKKNLKRARKNFWNFLKPGSGFGVGGTQIYFCPFCGKKLE